MLQLKGVTKDYVTAGHIVRALKGVDLRFRKNEFVSILGASGCGKTTMLNIIGGLDHYTSGDLIINGVSTKDYKDRDWDVYRNHRIGFVFQSYNLIPHQTVLGNVELSLTIAGVSKAERRKRAEEALIKVGLKEEMYKRPNQLSGGQMQRVAIARALVNNPEILLADEPTGALDTVTSVQIMDLIKEIAGERLVIMVTHNPELAEEYSSRIVRLQDGLVVSDSNPYEVEEEAEIAEIAQPQRVKAKSKKKSEKAAMSFKTSLGLSARNLLTKKGRTAITSFAGSIGIISVCLVLALSNGFNNYISKTQEDMLSYQPLEITETTVNMEAIMSGMMSSKDMPNLKELDNKAYVNSFLTNIAQGMTVTNDLSGGYIEYLEGMDESLYTSIMYDTGMDLLYNLYTEVDMIDSSKDPVYSVYNLKAYYTEQLSKQDEKYASLAPMVDMLGSIYGKLPGTTDMSKEGVGEYVLSQYDIIGEGSRFPTQSNEAVLVLGANNDITDLTLTQLGLLSEDRFLSLFTTINEDNLQSGKQEDLTYKTVEFDKIIGKKYKILSNDSIYGEGSGDYLFNYQGTKASLAEGEGIDVEIVGILRLKEGRNYGCLNSGLCFTEQLFSEIQTMNKDTALVDMIKTQRVALAELTALAAGMENLKQDSPEYQELVQKMIEFMTTGNGRYLKRTAKNLESYYISSASTGNTGMPSGMYFLYGDTALRAVGGEEKVNSIKIYTDSFDSKEGVLAHLDKWNDDHASEEDKGKQVKYIDTVGMMMTMVQSMLNAITYVLVAFTAISLVVSSVMIGIITYVSVVERTKEIGVLRSLGARKKDIKNLFNAETFIIGLTSGLFGVGVTYLTSIGINALLGALTGITTLASLPIASAAIMVAISVGLTLISGLIPAQAAAKKDPVVALRTE